MILTRLRCEKLKRSEICVARQFLDIFWKHPNKGVNMASNKPRQTPKALRERLRKEISLGFLENVQNLLKAGADPNKVDKEGRASLHFAAGSGRANMCQLLLEAGAEIEAKDLMGLTPLTYAAFGGLSMEKVPTEHLRDQQVPEPSAAAACIVLLHWGANPKSASVNGITPLHRAAGEYPSVCRILIQHGASIRASDEDGDAPLAYAAISPRPNAVERCGVLIEAGAIRNAKNRRGRTALHAAASRGRAMGIAALLDAGCNIQAKDSDGNTPLHLAARISSPEACRALVDRGANPLVRDLAGRLPIEGGSPIERLVWVHLPERRSETEEILRSEMIRLKMEKKIPKPKTSKSSTAISKRGPVV